MEPEYDIDDPQYVQEGSDTIVLTDVAGDELPPLLPGRPLMTIATIATTAAFVLTSVAVAALTVAGALPAGYEDAGASIAQWSGLAGALALGLGGLGKALYGAARARTVAPPTPPDGA